MGDSCVLVAGEFAVAGIAETRISPGTTTAHVGGSVVAGVQAVRIESAEQVVSAGVTHDEVAAGVAEKPVEAGSAAYDVGCCAPDDPVATCLAKQEVRRGSAVQEVVGVISGTPSKSSRPPSSS